jgi:hypothetical protein
MYYIYPSSTRTPCSLWSVRGPSLQASQSCHPPAHFESLICTCELVLACDDSKTWSRAWSQSSSWAIIYIYIYIYHIPPQLGFWYILGHMTTTTCTMHLLYDSNSIFCNHKIYLHSWNDSYVCANVCWQVTIWLLTLFLLYMYTHTHTCTNTSFQWFIVQLKLVLYIYK